MTTTAFFGKKLQHLRSTSTSTVPSSLASLGTSLFSLKAFLFNISPFWIQLSYFISFSFLGFFVLTLIEPRNGSFRPKGIDVFFTSVSATTVSSMSTVEMEVFSDAQLVVLTILMFLGGEVFVSMLGLHFLRYSKTTTRKDRISNNVISTSCIVNKNENLEDPDNFKSVSSRNYAPPQLEMGDLESVNIEFVNKKPDQLVIVNTNETNDDPLDNEDLKYNSLRYLVYVVLGYLIGVLLFGSTLVAVYIDLVPSASEVLKTKGLKLRTFSAFSVVSTFTNCGFIPTNENMIVFKKNSFLLLLLFAQVLLGNTLYPSCLRLLIWVLGKFSKRVEFSYMLKHTEEMEYSHFLPKLNSLCLFFTVFGFLLVQLILFCSMEWNNSEALGGLSPFQKLVGALFQVVNSRHAGETIVDLSTLSPAILVLFVLMMYLPPYTSFLPIKENKKLITSVEKKKKKRQLHLLQKLLFSQLSYLTIFVVLICITERSKMKDDPVNFSVLNVVVEVISAYGNVGFTTGYSCKRRLIHDSNCKDTWYGFSGRWSSMGKFILIMVMFFGRLKKFSMGGGKSWKLS